jgi:hypothetical protein
MSLSSICLDALGDGDITLGVFRNDPHEEKMIIVGIPRRQAKAIAIRILHEIDYADGKRARRPSSPHLFFKELQPCTDCGRKNAMPCAGRAGRTCPLQERHVPVTPSAKATEGDELDEEDLPF